MQLGKAIRYGRIKRDMTLKQLAEKAGVSTSYLSLLERGKRDPNMMTVALIAKALDVPLFLLIAGAEILGIDDPLDYLPADVSWMLALAFVEAFR